MPGRHLNSFQIFGSNTDSCSTSQCFVLWAAGLPLLELVWVMRTVFMESQINCLFAEKSLFKGEGTGRSPGKDQGKQNCGVAFITESRELITPGYPVISNS